MEILENEEGHQTLVMYSLGNFLSAQIQVDEILEGMGMWKVAMTALCFLETNKEKLRLDDTYVSVRVNLETRVL